MKQHKRSNISGFTMIELMIVLIIMGMMMAIVAPVSMQAIERSEAKVELQELKNWIKQLANQAVLTSTPITLELDGGEAKLTGDKLLEVQKLNYVVFAKKSLKINQFGIAVPQQVEASFKGEKLILKVGE